MIYVTPLSKLNETLAASGALHLVTLLRLGSLAFERPEIIAREKHLVLEMHDIPKRAPDMIAPGARHVAALLEFVKSWDQCKPLAINCYAGISRSTAAAYIAAATLQPLKNEHELAEELRRLSPSATPNPRLVALADRMLGRKGRMVRAITSIGRGTDAFEGVPFALKLN